MRSGMFAIALGVVTAVGVAVPSPAVAESGPQHLVGTFRFAAGSCNGGKATGSTFRMVLPNGSAAGPYVSNNDSSCSDHSFTLLTPGTDGGLVTGDYQPEPNPAFDGNGNSLASRISKPVRFSGVDFSTSTNAKDPQTAAAVPAPSVSVQDGKLTGDLRAFAASWNRQEFNQGAPKPDGSTPGNTTVASGTYDAASGAFSFTWASQIQGGPFNNFTGLWHLEGTFAPASGSSGSSSAAGGSSGASGTPGASGSMSPTTSPSTRLSGAGTGAAAGGAAATPAPGAAPASSVVTPTTATPGDSPAAPAAAGSEVAASQATASKPKSHGGGTPVGMILLAALVLAGVGAGGSFAVV